MRRVGFVLGALILVVGALVPALAQQPFADVPLDHWAYAAVNKLAETGLMEGYPDGTYKGKQPLTRYEFAQALARMLDRVEAMAKEPGPPGPPGPAGPPGPGAGAGLTAEQQALLDRLAKEFAPELKALRSDLDSLTKRVEDLEAKEAPKGPVVTVGGSINVRAGLYGTELGVKDTESTGYPYYTWYWYPDGGVPASEGPGFWPAPWGSINIPYWDSAYEMWSDDPDYQGGPYYVAGVPISDALKDAYKAADFMTQRTKVSFSGQLDEKTSANVTVLADARTNDSLRFGDYLGGEMQTSPNWLAGNGVMDTVKVDEAWVKHRTSLLVPVDITVGKQYFRRGVGLLADNSQEAIKALGLDWTASDSLTFGTVLGMLDREEFYGLSTSRVGWPPLEGLVGMYIDYEVENDGQDNYDLFYLDWKLSKSWAVGVNWLESGIGDEQGYSLSLMGKLYGLDVYGEYAKLQQWPSGKDFIDWNDDDVRQEGELKLSESDKAWVAGLKWDGDWLQLVAEYGQIDAGYAFALDGMGWSPMMWWYGTGFGSFNLPLSALHPLAEVNPHFINWVDRPLFLDPTNIARGWHVGLTFPKLLGESTPVSVSYASGDAYSGRYLYWLVEGGPESGIVEPDKWVDADPVWTVQVSRQLSQNVTARLLYGRREVDKVMSTQRLPYMTVEGEEGLVKLYATDDPIQVIRAELSVAF